MDTNITIYSRWEAKLLRILFRAFDDVLHAFQRKMRSFLRSIIGAYTPTVITCKCERSPCPAEQSRGRERSRQSAERKRNRTPSSRRSCYADINNENASNPAAMRAMTRYKEAMKERQWVQARRDASSKRASPSHSPRRDSIRKPLSPDRSTERPVIKKKSLEWTPFQRMAIFRVTPFSRPSSQFQTVDASSADCERPLSAATRKQVSNILKERRRSSSIKRCSPSCEFCHPSRILKAVSRRESPTTSRLIDKEEATLRPSRGRTPDTKKRRSKEMSATSSIENTSPQRNPSVVRKPSRRRSPSPRVKKPSQEETLQVVLNKKDESLPYSNAKLTRNRLDKLTGGKTVTLLHGTISNLPHCLDDKENEKGATQQLVCLYKKL